MARGDLLTFIEVRQFQAAWAALGLGDNELADLQNLILRAPERAPIIAGTGGVRKLRYAPASWQTGKRGAVRVCYLLVPSKGLVFFITAYAKVQKSDLSAAEKKIIRRMAQHILKEFS